MAWSDASGVRAKASTEVRAALGYPVLGLGSGLARLREGRAPCWALGDRFVQRTLILRLRGPTLERRLMPHRVFRHRLEEVMGGRHFKEPVFLRLNNAGNYQAGSPWEALQYLDIHWPAARTAEYRRAKAMCQSAIDGLVSPESARAYLIEAAERAGVLEQGWRFSAEDIHGAYRHLNHNAPAPTHRAS